jgi:hypothetical protein
VGGGKSGLMDYFPQSKCKKNIKNQENKNNGLSEKEKQ